MSGLGLVKWTLAAVVIISSAVVLVLTYFTRVICPRWVVTCTVHLPLAALLVVFVSTLVLKFLRCCATPLRGESQLEHERSEDEILADLAADFDDAEQARWQAEAEKMTASP